MKVLLRISVLLAILQSGNMMAKTTRIPLRDFFKNPEKAAFQISPDGNWISYLAPYEKRLNVFVMPRSGGEAVRVTGETARDLGGYFWKSSERIVYTKDKDGDENFHLFSVGRDGKNLKDLTPFDSVTVQIVDGLQDMPDELLIGMNKRNKEIFDVYRINIKTGAMTMAAENPGNITSWVTDHDGKIRVASTTDGVSTTLLYRATEKDEFKPILTTNFKEQVSPLFFTFDNKFIYAASNIGRDKTAIVKYDIANGKELEVLYSHPDVDVENLNYSHKRKVLTTITYTTWKRERKFLDNKTEEIFKDLQAKLPNYEVSISDADENETTYIVRTYSDRSLGSAYLYEASSKKLTKLADISPWIDENQMSEMKPISYKTRDGLTINGYLTIPKGSSGKNLPVIINPHGGPWFRDNWGYNPEAQLFANRGYAVLQMNFRGSTGYGKKFWEASFKQWGKTMQDDVSDGVKWLIDQGIANPKKVAIYGGSYGGYCTLAGMTFSPDLYACGIDYVGVSNLFTFLRTIPPYWKPYLDMFHEMVGDPEKDSVLLRETSPVFHVDNIKAPLLVIQGRKDPRVNIQESNQIVEALKKRGIDVPYLVKDNEGHGFHNEENRFAAYEAMESFLEKHLN
ncbi:MAG TPA: S9 family peptidase [Candidatus Kapabacteria bacterium]|nr:S9 family peptidase [Candidatus Kapabacteria bacterium]